MVVQLKQNACVGRFVKGFFKVEHDACCLFVEIFDDMLVQPENVALTAVFLSEASLIVWQDVVLFSKVFQKGTDVKYE